MSPTAIHTDALSFATRTIHADSDELTGAVVPPISLSTTFKYAKVSKTTHPDFVYSRDQNPTRKQLEEVLGAIEGGQRALCVASGSAATASVIQTLGSGAHILSMEDVYSGTAEYIHEVAAETQLLESTFLDLVDSSDQVIYDAIRPNTKMIWIESPTNPTLRIVSIPRIVRIAASHPSKPLVAVDSTFASPYYTNSIAQGVDIVVHSVSKYISGHSDVIMGAIIVRPGREDVWKKLNHLQIAGGAIPSPFDAYLVLRGLKTLSVRAFQHGLNALTIARFLADHPSVDLVSYPGLISAKTEKAYEVVKASMSTQVNKDLKRFRWNEQEEGGVPFGGVLSFSIKGGAEAAERFLYASKLFALAESLGGVESLAEVASEMSHQQLPAAERLRLGITPNLIRMSVGIEDVDDLVADIQQALEASQV